MSVSACDWFLSDWRSQWRGSQYRLKGFKRSLKRSLGCQGEVPCTKQFCVLSQSAMRSEECPQVFSGGEDISVVVTWVQAVEPIVFWEEPRVVHGPLFHRSLQCFKDGQ